MKAMAQRGACVVQCPKDALFFENADGERIEPAVILLGERTVDSS